MSFNMNMVTHMRAVRECMPKFGARIEFKFGTLQLEVRARGRYYDFFPQYAVIVGGKMKYVSVLTDESTLFVGWRPYVGKGWDLSTDKLAFKQYCRANALAVPELFTSADQVTTDVIVKLQQSSFGEGILGPFQPHQAKALNRPLAEGEYYEEFIRGQIVKAWYWNDCLVVLELKPMVEVVGDGKSSLRELLEGIKSSFLAIDWSAAEIMAHYQEMVSLDDIPAAGRAILVEFKYLSGLHSFTLTNQNVLDEYKAQNSSIVAQLEHAGPLLWKAIPEAYRENTLYTADAIVGPDGVVRFLEMNSNPVVHPDSYLPMFAGLFGKPSQPVHRGQTVPESTSPQQTPMAGAVEQPSDSVPV